MKRKKLQVKLGRPKVSHIFKLVMLITTLLTIACSDQISSNQANNLSQRNSEASSSPKQCQSIQHALGETQVCGQPTKIVALGPNMLEILLALEVQPVGYADYFSLPYQKFDQPDQQILYLGEQVTSQPSNVGTSGDPSLEAIAKLKPDLILGGVEANNDEYALLSQIAPTLLFTYGVDNEWEQQIQVIAKALGRSEQAERVIVSHTERLAQTREALKPVAKTYPRLLLLLSERLEQNLRIDPYNYSTHCSALLEDLGFQLVFPPNSKRQKSIGGNVSLETLPQLEADLIIVQAFNRDSSNSGEDLVNHQLNQVKQQWNNNAIAQSLEASKADRVYFTSAYLCRAVPGPIGTEIFLNQLRQQLLSSNAKTGEL
ncbi:MAG: iron-siderophore ABC transporter substrate-binding protein [Coleofasciculaceae cyanobacterium]